MPGRTVVDIGSRPWRAAAELKNVVGVKDATANVARVSQQRAGLRHGLHPALGRGRDRARLHGARRPRLHLGHLQRRPALCAEFQNACLKGDYKAALALQDRLMPLHDALFVETNPAP